MTKIEKSHCFNLRAAVQRMIISLTPWEISIAKSRSYGSPST
ncbi:8111_t:CDS:2 [Funneliformis geosporum]|uniref:8111_t:CDS:1 n=1 Tax=Funneliformis geosporum TaxID=1117311 RepID=A0A9W4SUL8_9GLOM|nr:8111_t:CDS:2 [Funneliformis geosporum]